mmetsp:Transcript_92697/g.200385  ORF Transcript_92697/g.200385 Transcript_92697/m.200385 type:complete len:92 (+) Transcript_92697:546-821(+)
MHELSNIVLGIRLFNRAIDKGGVGLVSFEELYDLMSTGNTLDHSLTKFVMELVNETENYTHFLKVSDKWVESSADKMNADKTVERVKEELV